MLVVARRTVMKLTATEAMGRRTRVLTFDFIDLHR